MGRGGGKTVVFDTRQHHGSSDTQSQQSQQLLNNGSGGYSDRNTASPHSSQNSYRQPEVNLYLALSLIYIQIDDGKQERGISIDGLVWHGFLLLLFVF